MGKYFGTDGVRGVANSQLTPELAFQLGRCGAARLLRDSDHPLILVGRDTRRSGAMLEAALAAGICSVGVDVGILGVTTTPSVAWLTKHSDSVAGIMISASHNPAADNGIKFFSHQGFKLPDSVEEEIEALIDNPADLPRPTGAGVGRIVDSSGRLEEYVQHVMNVMPEGLSGMRIAVDCANGASYRIAPRVLRALGAEIHVIADEPNGDNINLNCGSTHLGALAEEVKRGGYDLGLAFDGDADRVLAVDELGNPVDGDRIMLICLKQMRKKGLLDSPSLVATVMSNLGFQKAIEAEGGELIRAKVGDRYVLEEMVARGIKLGGEQSGHIIFLEHNTTGDGLVTALSLLGSIRGTGRSLSSWAAEMTNYPQILKNLRVENIKGWEENPRIKAAIAQAEKELHGNGRLVVRASGTEPLLRVMVEGPTQQDVERIADDIIKVMAEELLSHA